MGFSIIIRRAASSLALRSAVTRAQNVKALNVRDHGRLSQEIRIPLSCRYLSSDAKKTSVVDTNKLSAEQQRVLNEIVESTKKASVENTKKRTKKLSAEEQGILKIVAAALESMNNINKIDGIPFTMEDHEELLVLKREYENEEIHVKISNYAFESGMFPIPMYVEVCKEGRLSLDFEVRAFPEEIEIISFFIGTKDVQGQANYERPDFLNINSELEKAFLKYLDIRGINTTVFNCILQHINQKMDSLVWLENLKKFIEI